MLAIYLVLFVLCAYGRLVRPLEEFTYGESWLLDGARRVARGEGLYAAADHVPLMHIAYTPLYYVLVGAAQRVVGDHGYTVGRVVSLVATLGGTLAMSVSLRGLTGRWWVGLLAAGLFLTQNMTALLWAPLHRVDGLALGLTLTGLALATTRRVSLAAVCFLLALTAKQTYVVAPLVVALWLWPSRRDLWRFVAIVGGGAVAGVLLAQWITGGWFWWHTVAANNNEADLLTFAILMGSFMQFNGLTVAAAVASFVLPASRGEWLWRLYLIGTLLTLPTLAKLGASSNYWLEVSAAVAAVLALASFRLALIPGARLVAPVVLAGAMCLAIPGYQATAYEAAAMIGDRLRPPRPLLLSMVGDGDSLTTMRVDAGFVARLAAEPGALLTDNSGLAVAAGKPIEFEFQIFQLLGAEGRWTEQPIVAAVNARQFALVALMHPLDGGLRGTRWTPGVVDALNAAYEPAGQEAGFWLYRPRA
jgi:hypothetical protein